MTDRNDFAEMRRILEIIANTEPWCQDNGGDKYCVYCELDRDGEHEPKCAYILARALLAKDKDS